MQNERRDQAVCLELGFFPAVRFGFRAGDERPEAVGVRVTVHVTVRVTVHGALAPCSPGVAPGWPWSPAQRLTAPRSLLGDITWRGGRCSVLNHTHPYMDVRHLYSKVSTLEDF